MEKCHGINQCPCPLRTPEPKFRLVRILEYIGDEEWIKKTMLARSVKDVFDVGRGKITETILRDAPTNVKEY